MSFAGHRQMVTFRHCKSQDSGIRFAYFSVLPLLLLFMMRSWCTRSPQLFRECAGILEGMKQLAEAAAMYELGGEDDKAAAIYVSGKDIDKAAMVMPRVTLPKLLGQYAKACEITGRYKVSREIKGVNCASEDWRSSNATCAS